MSEKQNDDLQLITVKMPQELINKISKYMQLHNLDNRSNFIRYAIESVIDGKNTAPTNLEKMSLNELNDELEKKLKIKEICAVDLEIQSLLNEVETARKKVNAEKQKIEEIIEQRELAPKMQKK